MKGGEYIMGQLADEAKKRNPYLTLKSGETIEATYKGFKLVPSSFDPTKDNFRFILGVNIDGREYEKYWDTGSNKVALVFDQIPVGETVYITKTVENVGLKNERTRWEVNPSVPVEIDESQNVKPEDVPF